MARVGIIGGGPGGLMTAYRLGQRLDRRCGGVSGQSGGLPVGEPIASHRPDADGISGLCASTLNAVLRSAELAVELLAEDIGAGRTGTCLRAARPVCVA